MKKKILCLVIHSLQSGGMERVMAELAGYFCNKPELEVHMVMYGKKPELFYNIPSNLILHNPEWEFNDSSRFWNTLKRMWYLRSTIKKIAPDSILSFGEYFNNLVLLALLGLKFPVYVSDRCQPGKRLVKLHNILRKVLYSNTAGVIVQTEKAREIYQKNMTKANIRVIGNPIRSISEDIEVKKENIVLSVGRLIKSKHHDELIRSFISIRQPGWKMVIVGDDAQKQKNRIKLEALITELRGEDIVTMAGLQNDIDSFYRRSRIFAFMSDSEGFPNVVGEAMAAGLPVVAFDCVAGPSDMIKDGENGFLIPLNNYDMFKERLKSLMTNESLRKDIGTEAQKSIGVFNIKKVGNQFYSVITDHK